MYLRAAQIRGRRKRGIQEEIAGAGAEDGGDDDGDGDGNRVVNLRGQLDEAGRLGLKLYEENQQLHATIEELRANAGVSVRKVHDDKVLINELEESENEIKRLVEENKRLKGEHEVAKHEIAKLKNKTKEEHSMSVKNKLRIGAMKATASFQARHMNKLKGSGSDAMETIEWLTGEVKTAEAAVSTITKEKLALRGKLVAVQRTLRETRSFNEELKNNTAELEESLDRANEKCEKLKCNCERLRMELRSLKDAEDAHNEQVERRLSNAGQSGRAGSPAEGYVDDDDDEMMAMLAGNSTVNIRDEIMHTPPPFVSPEARRKRRGNSLSAGGAGVRKQHLQRLKLSNELKTRFSMTDLLASAEAGDGTAPVKVPTPPATPSQPVEILAAPFLNRKFDGRKDEYDRKLQSLKLELSETTSILINRLNLERKPVFVITSEKKETFTSYVIQVLFHDGRSHTTSKRYSDFVTLRNRLLQLCSGSILTIPYLPPKYFSRDKNMSLKVVEERRGKFLNFLNIMVSLIFHGDIDVSVSHCFWQWLELKDDIQQRVT
jgi:myosin heavy subunit